MSDFKYEKTKVEKYLGARGHKVIPNYTVILSVAGGMPNIKHNSTVIILSMVWNYALHLTMFQWT